MFFEKYSNALSRRIKLFVRRHTSPISADEAQAKKEFFSKFYALSSVALFSYLCIATYQKKEAGFKNVDIDNSELYKSGKRRIRFVNFKRVEDVYYEMPLNEEKKDEEKKDEENISF